ncbi:MAG: C-GCAxxG-C-C family protein [Spirochaetota bacterium]
MKADDAIDYFRQGYNCAQSVFTVFAKENGLTEDMALKLSTGLGAGRGRLQSTCGAVTGGCLAIGMIYGKGADDDTNEKRDTTYELVRRFDAEFSRAVGSTSCRDILGCDLTTDEGKKRYEAENMRENKCEPAVAEAVKILETLL